MRHSPRRPAKTRPTKSRSAPTGSPKAEHGGFYQALADGTYRNYGLDVTIVQGGPQVNNRLLLAVGRIDFFMSTNTLQSFDAVAQSIPTLAVAAMFQKDPQVMIAHPDRGIDSLRDLKGLTLFISQEGVTTYFQWLKREFGLSDSQVRPYTFNPQPFIADKNSAMQGYVTSEPYAIAKITGFKPKVFLLADNGFKQLFHPDPDAARPRRPQARRRAALRRCLDRSAGTTISTATTVPPTRSSSETIRR